MSKKRLLEDVGNEKPRKQATQIRIDEELFLDLKTIADDELRTLNAQIEYFLLHGVKEYHQARKNFYQHGSKEAL